jgi:hypothetical protein
MLNQEEVLRIYYDGFLKWMNKQGYMSHPTLAEIEKWEEWKGQVYDHYLRNRETGTPVSENR